MEFRGCIPDHSNYISYIFILRHVLFRLQIKIYGFLSEDPSIPKNHVIPAFSLYSLRVLGVFECDFVQAK